MGSSFVGNGLSIWPGMASEVLTFCACGIRPAGG
jgi:hypothetical protein